MKKRLIGIIMTVVIILASISINNPENYANQVNAAESIKNIETKITKKGLVMTWDKVSGAITYVIAANVKRNSKEICGGMIDEVSKNKVTFTWKNMKLNYCNYDGGNYFVQLEVAATDDEGTIITNGKSDYIKVYSAKKNKDGCKHKWKKTIKKATKSKNGKIKSQCKKCNRYCADVVIKAAKKITLSEDVFIYDGTSKKPKVLVKDKSGKAIKAKNYSVKYEADTMSVGIHTVTVKFKNQYKGIVKLQYKIEEKEEVTTNVNISI